MQTHQISFLSLCRSFSNIIQIKFFRGQPLLHNPSALYFRREFNTRRNFSYRKIRNRCT